MKFSCNVTLLENKGQAQRMNVSRSHVKTEKAARRLSPHTEQCRHRRGHHSLDPNTSGKMNEDPGEEVTLGDCGWTYSKFLEQRSLCRAP